MTTRTVLRIGTALSLAAMLFGPASVRALSVVDPVLEIGPISEPLFGPNDALVEIVDFLDAPPTGSVGLRGAFSPGQIGILFRASLKHPDRAGVDPIFIGVEQPGPPRVFYSEPTFAGHVPGTGLNVESVTPRFGNPSRFLGFSFEDDLQSGDTVSDLFFVFFDGVVPGYRVQAGFFRSVGVINAFSTTIVPEPEATLLVLVGLSVLLRTQR